MTLKQGVKRTAVISVLLVFVILIWWTKFYMSPRRAFGDMLVHNLTTTNVTKSELASSNGQDSLQNISLQLSGNDAARWLVTLQQKTGVITTESIGTPSTGYVRYTQLQDTNTKKSFKKVLNVWAKAQPNDGTVLSKVFSQSMIDVSSAPVPPIGNPEVTTRRQILSYIKSEAIFTPNYKTVKSGIVNGRQVYVIDVSVKLAPYVKMMQVFSHAYGLGTLDKINPTDYQASAPVRLQISIDKVAHTMARVGFQTNHFVETYSDYGLHTRITPPQHAIATTELQKRLQAAQ